MDGQARQIQRAHALTGKRPDPMEHVQLFIHGEWRPARSCRTISVLDPATGETIGSTAEAGEADLDDAVAAAVAGFKIWRRSSPMERSAVLRRTADLLRERIDAIARLLTAEQGKPLREARSEITSAAETLDWFAEESRRAYGSIIPSRDPTIRQLVHREPIGPVAAFTPWNFPIGQIVLKLGAALAAGCSIIVKAPEDTPSSPAALFRALADAGLPPGVANLVTGVPAQISNRLIPHPAIRKVSFTGSVPVGKHLAALAGAHMKRSTMELGGHGPVIVTDDADIEQAADLMSGAKRFNAGQVCISPTRFLIQQRVYDRFLDRFVNNQRAIRVGNGTDPDTGMGPLVSPRRREAVEDLMEDAVNHGAKLEGGARIGNAGNFLAPAILTGVTPAMRIANEEPFGPISLMMPFLDIDDAIAEANRLPYALAAYAFVRSNASAAKLQDQVQAGMISFNGADLALPETPFGGIKDSGYGSEGGPDAMNSYLNVKFVSERPL